MLFGSLFRLGLLTTLVGGSAVALFGTDRVKLYLEHGKETVLSAIDDAQGMEAKLSLIRTQIDGLDRSVRDLREEAVSRKVESEDLRREIAERERSLERQMSVLDRASDLLAKKSETYTIGRTVYTRQEVEKDAADKLQLYGVQQETLKSLKETLATKEKALELADQNVGRAIALKSELQGKIGLLEAKLQKFRAREAFAATVDDGVSTVALDSDLAKAREMIQGFEKKLEVKDRMLDERMKSSGTQPKGGIDYTVTPEGDANLVGLIRAAIGRVDAVAAPSPSIVVAVNH